MGLVALLMIVASPLHAAAGEPAFVVAVWGNAAPDSLYLGMWTRHRHPGVDDNQLIAMTYKGYFGGTFINSYDERTYGVGVQRDLLAKHVADRVKLHLGYRFGVIYGYDEKLLPAAGKIPIVPFVQPLAELSWKRAGIQASYCWLVVSGGFFVRF